MLLCLLSRVGGLRLLRVALGLAVGLLLGELLLPIVAALVQGGLALVALAVALVRFRLVLGVARFLLLLAGHRLLLALLLAGLAVGLDLGLQRHLALLALRLAPLLFGLALLLLRLELVLEGQLALLTLLLFGLELGLERQLTLFALRLALLFGRLQRVLAGLLLLQPRQLELLRLGVATRLFGGEVVLRGLEVLLRCFKAGLAGRLALRLGFGRLDADERLVLHVGPGRLRRQPAHRPEPLRLLDRHLPPVRVALALGAGPVALLVAHQRQLAGRVALAAADFDHPVDLRIRKRLAVVEEVGAGPAVEVAGVVVHHRLAVEAMVVGV